MINTIIETKIKSEVTKAVRNINVKAEITNENFQSFVEDLHNLLWNRAGLPPHSALEHMSFFFAYRMIEQQADKFNLPQECRWSYISTIKDEDELFEIIKKGVVSFRKNSNTYPFFKQHEIKKAEIVYDMVQEISRVPIKILQETDVLGDIYEYMMGRGMSGMADEGQYFTNRSICRLAFKLSYSIKKTLRRPDGSLCTFADWFCGTGGFPAEYIKGVRENLKDVNWEKDFNSIYCQDQNVPSVDTTRLNLLILTGIPFSCNNIRSGNSFTDPITIGETAPFKGVTIDYCFKNPPYGGDKTKGKEYKFAYAKGKGDAKKFMVNKEIQSIGIEDDDKVSAGVQLSMATLSADGGVCAIVLPQGFFFGVSKKCVELRKKIAEEYKIHYVVDIASGSFLNTGTKTSMMVFQKGMGPTEKVSFIGLDEKPIVEATLDELRVKNYSLNYKQYMSQSTVEVDGFEMVKLGDIIELETGTYITKKTSDEGPYPVYGGGGISSYISQFNRENKFVIAKDGVSETCVRFVHDKFFLNHHGWTFHTTKECVNYQYIGHWLMNNQSLIYSLAVGTAQKGINQDTFLSLEIPLPSLERQQEIVDSIDGFTKLAWAEEQLLKMLEKSVMFEVKWMGMGKKQVKLGDVCELKSGFAFKSSEFTKSSTDMPVLKITNVNNGFVSFGTEPDRIPSATKYIPFIVKDGDSVISLTGLTDGKILAKYTLPFTSYLNQRVGMLCKYKDTVLPDYIYYYLLQNTSTIIELGVGSCQKNVSPSQIMDIELPLPPLTEQQTLQSDFDEIRHKHAKIAEYKAKAQEAIQRLIPSIAKKEINEISNPKTDYVSESGSVSSDTPKRKRPQIAK
jgi:type I restriction enzyme S subunit